VRLLGRQLQSLVAVGSAAPAPRRGRIDPPYQARGAPKGCPGPTINPHRRGDRQAGERRSAVTSPWRFTGMRRGPLHRGDRAPVGLAA